MAAHDSARSHVDGPKIEILTEHWVVVNAVVEIEIQRQVPVAQVGRTVTRQRYDICAIGGVAMKGVDAEDDAEALLELFNPDFPLPRVDAIQRDRRVNALGPGPGTAAKQRPQLQNASPRRNALSQRLDKRELLLAHLAGNIEIIRH